MRPNLITRALKSREVSLAGVSQRVSEREEGIRLKKTQGKKDLTCNASIKKGMRVTIEAEDNLQPTVSKERGTSILPSHGAGFCQQPE